MMGTIVHADLIYGIVNTKVAVTAATTKKDTVTFRLLHSVCGTPIVQPRMCPRCEVPPMQSEVIRGWEYAKGQFALVTNDEYTKVHKHREPVIEIKKFVSWESRMLPARATYHLADENTRVPAYQLLAQAMFDNQVDGMGRCNLWDRERPFRLTANSDRGLLLQTMFTADELVKIETPPLEPLSDEYLDITTLLIQERMGVFSFDDLVIEADRTMRKLVEAKAVGKPAPKLVKAAKVEPTSDLMAALKSSVKSKPSRKKAAKAA